MKKEKNIVLEFYRAIRTPPFSKEDYESGEALTLVADWAERNLNRYRSLIYRDKGGNLYRIERYMPTSKKAIADMMLMERERIGVLQESSDTFFYKIEDPRPIVKLNTIIEGKVIREKGSIKIIELEIEAKEKEKNGTDLIRIIKVGKRRI